MLVVKSSYACLTKIVLAHKWGNKTCSSASSDTRACFSRISALFIKTTSKGPDVLARRTMRHTDSFNIDTVNWPTRTIIKGIWSSYLVANDPPTHLVILLTTSCVVDPITATTGGPSPTHPVWEKSDMGWVRHVEVGYMSPASCPTTRCLLSWRFRWKLFLKERYCRLLEQFSCCIFDLISRYPSLYLRRAGQAAISLQDLGRVGERKGGVGSLGNSRLN